MNNITEKQKCIAEQAIYGDLKGKAISGLIYPIKCSYNDVIMVYESSIISQEDIKPILRPMFDLIKEITHKGYNDDKPFVPFITLDNIQPKPSDRSLAEQIEIDDLLHQWHFDTRKLIEQGEAVDANTLTKNPYEV